MKRMMLVAAVLAWASIATPGPGRGQTTVAPEPQGVLCLTPLGSGSSVAVRLALPKDKALAGVRWYNNDGSTAFPRLTLSVAGGEYPQRENGTTAAERVVGLSSHWSEIDFDQPLASAAKAVDVIFEVPQDAALTAEGVGGGAAFGYRTEAGGPSAFVSSDGQEWTRLRATCRLLVEPVLVAREAGTAMLEPPEKAAEAVRSWDTALLLPRPNPGNPAVTIAFTLAREMPVELTIFDLRGRQVAILLHELQQAGSHEVLWAGRDGAGRPVGSGVYFARLRAGRQDFSRRLLLVR